MKINFLKSIIFSVILAIVCSCVNDDDYTDEISPIKTYELVSNKLVAQVSASTTTNIPVLYTSEDIIEAYVTSNDESGNFFSTICFQTFPVAGSIPTGFSVSADFKSFGHGFTPGRKVYIKLKGLYIAKVDGSLKIGALYFDGTNNEIGRISTFEWEKYLFPSATIVPESQLVTTTTVNLLNNNNNLNILTEIDNVQFGDNAIGRPLFDVTLPVLGLATNHTIVGVGTTATSIFRTSSFSSFARATVPAGRGKIRGVLTKFGSTFQFYIRNLEDFKLSNPRTYPFSVASTEGFESFATNQKIFSNYLNFSTEGTKDWIVRSGKVLEMSAFGGAIERNKSYFMVPVDMTAANTFSFQVNIQFYANRQVLRVFRTMDYVPGMKIKDATLVDISGNLSIPIENTVGMVSAGTYNIPSTVIGNGYFVFEYTGSNLTSETVITTNVQIDNIVIN